LGLVCKNQKSKQFLFNLQEFSLKKLKDKFQNISELLPLIHSPSKILSRLSKTMHGAASLRKKGKTLSLPLHACSKHMRRWKVLLGQGIF